MACYREITAAGLKDPVLAGRMSPEVRRMACRWRGSGGRTQDCYRDGCYRGHGLLP
jgi:hypothetical protein